MRHAVIGFTLLLAACGSSASLDTAQIQAFNSAAQDVSMAAATYGSQAAAMTSVASCASAQSAYGSQVRPPVARMQGMGPSMDAMMGSMNHMDMEDMACSANAMMAELDRHQAAACTSTADMAPNAAEAQQHGAAMTRCRWQLHLPAVAPSGASGERRQAGNGSAIKRPSRRANATEGRGLSLG
jgi:hypothetical protein